jgi:hypothetical protein
VVGLRGNSNETEANKSKAFYPADEQLSVFQEKSYVIE